MDESLKDAIELVDSYNEVIQDEFGGQYRISAEAIPQIATMMYQHRVMQRTGQMPPEPEQSSFR